MKKTENYHYTYLIKNKNIGLLYIGVHTGYGEYWGSSKSLSEDIKKIGKQYFVKRILRVWDTRAEAMSHEIELHNRYDVAVNNRFYNKVKQTSTGFDNTGVTCSDLTKQKKSRSVKQPVNNPLWKATVGELKKKTVSNTRQNWSKERKAAFSKKISITRKEKGLAKGKNNPFYGKKMSLGKKWYSNIDDDTSLLCYPGAEPTGYYLGRITVRGRRNPGYKNGKYCHEDN